MNRCILLRSDTEKLITTRSVDYLVYPGGQIQPLPPLVAPPASPPSLTSWSGWVRCQPAPRCGSHWQAPCPAGTQRGPCCPWCGTQPAGPSQGTRSLQSPGTAPGREREKERARLNTDKHVHSQTQTCEKGGETHHVTICTVDKHKYSWYRRRGISEDLSWGIPEDENSPGSTIHHV